MEAKSLKIEEKCNLLKEELKKQSQNLLEVNNTINRLGNDRKIIESNICKLDGAIQAYSEAVRVIEEDHSQ